MQQLEAKTVGVRVSSELIIAVGGEVALAGRSGRGYRRWGRSRVRAARLYRGCGTGPKRVRVKVITDHNFLQLVTATTIVQSLT